MYDNNKETAPSRRLRKLRHRAGGKNKYRFDSNSPPALPPGIGDSVSWENAGRQAELRLTRWAGLKPGLPTEKKWGEELFRSIFEHANAGMNTITPEGRFLQVNPAFCRFLGYSREELNHLTVFDLTHPDDQAATKNQFAQIKAGLRQAFDYEKRFLHKNGREVWGHVTSAWLFDDGKAPLFGIGLVQDITDRKNTENDLVRALVQAQQARDKIDGILLSLGEGLIVIDDRRHVSLMSPSAENLLGVSCRNAVNQPVELIFAGWPGLLQALTEGEDGGVYELELKPSQEGKPRILQARLSTIQGGTGLPAGRIAVLHDVTTEREVSRLKTQFVTTAAHELRTPLTSILGFSELLLRRADLNSGEQESIFRIIQQQGEGLSKIVDDLLDLSRIESGAGYVLEKTVCGLDELIDRAIARVSPEEEHFRIRVRFLTDIRRVHADPNKMCQALENLLSNAVKFSPQGGPIELEVGRLGGELQLTVSDRGIGMTDDQAGRIFDKFYRVDSSNSAVEGIGLGMNIVKEIVEAHNGRIWVESAKGIGTKVTLSFPLLVDESGELEGHDSNSGFGDGELTR